MPEENFLLRANVSGPQAEQLKKHPDVLAVWSDSQIAPFENVMVYDCTPQTPKGTLADIAHYLGADQLWQSGFDGEGVVIAIVDGGITASGQPVAALETSRRIPQVTNGFPANWGTTAMWREHGNMCATDVLGIAPKATLYDIRIAGGSGSPVSFISSAIAGYQWCLEQFRKNGTPHILSNSWGIYQSAWDRVYATNPAHPFTRKMEEVLNAGMIVLFAAGNCGSHCADGRCAGDTGPGKSIWGANGHPRVMTVGAANKNEALAGYSSQGPAALDPNKPDFCSPTHFEGYFKSDSGTSAATPVAAGIVALMKQKYPAVSQSEVKEILMTTAKDIGPAGWDHQSGAGMIQGKKACDALKVRENATV